MRYIFCTCTSANSCTHKRLVSLLTLLPLLFSLLLPASIVNAAPPSRLQSVDESLPSVVTHTFTAPNYQIITDENGNQSINLEGFYPAGLPGDPGLPSSLYYVALPPQVPLESVTIEISTTTQAELPGIYQIAPLGPYIRLQESEPTEDWGPNAAAIVDGKNSVVYGTNTYFPAEPIELVTVSQMRKWHFAEIRYWPVQYNPVRGQLQVTTEITIALHYDVPVVAAQSMAELQDTLMDEQAAAMFVNFSEAQTWNQPNLQERATAANRPIGYAIITTDEIASAVNLWNHDFIAHKEAIGFKVSLVTESAGPNSAPGYGTLSGPWPHERPEQVRQWLMEHWLSDNIKYVLLIGNPDPRDYLNIKGDQVGDLPMKMTWPSGLSTDSGKRYATDHYFADLTGNWDKDNDGWYGGWYSKDYSVGGVDFWPEVYVGRVPVYTSEAGWQDALDRILHKTIAYEQSADRDWRRSILLPMAFLARGSDMAELAEEMKADYLEVANFSTYRMYMSTHDAAGDNLCVSSYLSSSNETLVDGAVREYWRKNPVGIVTWAGHGWAEGVSLGYNNCGVAENSLDLGGLFTSADATALNDSKPALTFQLSCSTGRPDNANNLGYALLKNGAIATVSASADTSGFTDQLPTPWSVHNRSLAYFYVKYLVANKTTGEALFRVKASPDHNTYFLGNVLAYNLYGDPSIQLLGNETPSRHPESDISTGSNHSCLLESDGSVNCWGSNFYGQATDHVGPYVQVSAGSDHTCALKPDGRVDCWGQNRYGQATPPADSFAQISAGQFHTCGLKNDGIALCWGANEDGQASPPVGPFIQIDAGNDTCGLRPDGRAECWGGAESQPGPFSQISAGTWHICGLKFDGNVDCWGSNVAGQAEDQVGPFAQVSAGGWHTCAMKPGGSVFCWGDNDQGAAEASEGPFAQISAGGYHTCGLNSKNSETNASCWGANEHGQANDQCRTVAGNLVKNFCFTEGKEPWQLYPNTSDYILNSDAPLAGEYSAQITINTPGSRNQWYQHDIKLLPNTPYELSFAAYSEDGEDMRIFVHKHSAPFTTYGLDTKRIDLSYWDWGWSIYRFTFVTPDLPDMNDARLRFWFAPYAKPGTVYHLDQIVLRPLDDTQAASERYTAPLTVEDARELLAGAEVSDEPNAVEQIHLYLPLVIKD